MNKHIALLLLGICMPLWSQPWQQNDAVFNPSGIPSLPFSQPRFADLDADGDFDMLLGSIDDPLRYFENTGSRTLPHFTAGPDLFAAVGGLQAEMGVFYDIDADGDPDLVTGGYLGLFLFENSGDSAGAVFTESATNPFAELSCGASPVPTLADMDGDGDADLLVGLSEDGRLKYYPNTGDEYNPQFSESNAQFWFDVGLYAYPVFTDPDNDDDVDLLSGRDAHGFKFYKNNGDSGGWQWQDQSDWFAGPGGDTYWNSPAVVDLTGDGKPDLVYGTAAGPLQFYANTGNPSAPQWTAVTSLFGGVIDVGGASSPCFYDWDGDGDLDMLSGSQLGDIKYYRNTGTRTVPAWQPDHSYFSGINHSIYSSVSAADVNGDSLPDLLVGDLSGELYLHLNTGSGFSAAGPLLSGIDLGWTSAAKFTDFDGDRDFDIIAGNEDGNLFYFENTGTVDSAAWREISGFSAILMSEVMPYPS